jgi:hypothetical protein
MAETNRKLHQLLKGNQLNGVYKEVLHELTAVLKGSAVQGETAKTTITALLSIEEFREQRRPKRTPKDETGKRVKQLTASTLGGGTFNCGRNMKFPPGISLPH